MKDSTSAEVILPLMLWKEEAGFVSFTPALDLSSCGETEGEAIKNFAQAVELFIEIAVERGTLKEILESLGWRLDSEKWIPQSEVIDGRPFTVKIPLPNKNI